MSILITLKTNLTIENCTYKCMQGVVKYGKLVLGFIWPDTFEYST